jgi:general stress protein YciG
MAERKKEMTVREAGHKGGSTTKQRYGEGFYEEIGKKGGKIGGKKGGTTTKQRYGEGFYEEIGKKGGQKVRELIERGKAATAESKPAGRKK